MPVRNEEQHIGRALEAVRNQRYDSDLLEIIVADGRSADATRQIISRMQALDARIRLIDNPNRIAASGLNAAIAVARGDVIVRVDGHCEIPRNYVSTCVEMLRSGGADCVGGPVRARGEGPTGAAVAAAMSSVFGVGGATFRLTPGNTLRQVAHLPFAAWPRHLLERVGGFDESMVRDQDDELSGRLRRAGARIVMHPGIVVTYRCRESIGGLWRQYFGYGYWKINVIRRRGRPAAVRHVVPASFVIALAAGLGIGLAWSQWLPLLVLLGAYGTFLLAATLALGARHNVNVVWRIPVALAAMHLSYGIGFLMGLKTSWKPLDRRTKSFHASPA